MQEVDTGDHCITRIARKVAQVIKEDQVLPVVDEWKLYQHQEIPEDWYKTDETESTRIDRHYKYFRSRLAGSEVFQHLKKLIRAVLTISHDNAVATGRNT